MTLKERKTGTRLRNPADLKRYIAKLLCKLEKLPDKELLEKSGAISKLGDTFLRAWHNDMEDTRIRQLEKEIYALKSGHPLQEPAGVQTEPESE